MKRRLAAPAALGLIVVLALGSAGCGSDGSDGDSAAHQASVERRARSRQIQGLEAKLRAERAEAARVAKVEKEAEPLQGVMVAIDPGHNGGNGSAPETINAPVIAYADGSTKACDTTGTETNDGALTESEFNLDVAQLLAERLRGEGAHVVMTRTSNDGIGPCIDERAAIGNRAGADVAISIHADGNEAADARGFDVIYPDPGQLVDPEIAVPSKQLAIDLRDELAEGGAPIANYVGQNGLDERDDLGGLNLSSVPKALVELGNMRSSSEAAQLESAGYRSALAESLARGIGRYLGSGAP